MVQKKSVATVSEASEEEVLTPVFLSVRAGLQILTYAVGVYFHEFSG